MRIRSTICLSSDNDIAKFKETLGMSGSGGGTPWPSPSLPCQEIDKHVKEKSSENGLTKYPEEILHQKQVSPSYVEPPSSHIGKNLLWAIFSHFPYDPSLLST